MVDLESVLDKKISEMQALETIYRDGVMLFLNACIGEKWRDVIATGDWEKHFAEPLMAEADFIAKYVEAAKISEHADALSYQFEKLKEACKGDTYRDLLRATHRVSLMGYYGAHVMAAREVARSKIEHSRSLMRKRLTPIEARRKKLTEIWLSGKFSSRDRCAEEEWEALGFPSYRAARESLIGTPDPTIS